VAFVRGDLADVPAAFRTAFFSAAEVATVAAACSARNDS
jgi:hypothetical protein